MSFHPYYTIKPSELVGLKFRNKKYAHTAWTDVIQRVELYLEYDPKFKEYFPIFKIYGKRFRPYDLSEILILEVDLEIAPKFVRAIGKALKKINHKS